MEAVTERFMQKKAPQKRKRINPYERKRLLYQILTVIVSLAIIFVWIVTMIIH